jgi:hypothetical protein
MVRSSGCPKKVLSFNMVNEENQDLFPRDFQTGESLALARIFPINRDAIR